MATGVELFSVNELRILNYIAIELLSIVIMIHLLEKLEPNHEEITKLKSKKMYKLGEIIGLVILPIVFTAYIVVKLIGYYKVGGELPIEITISSLLPAILVIFLNIGYQIDKRRRKTTVTESKK